MKKIMAALLLMATGISQPAGAVGFICPPGPISYISINMVGDLYTSAGYGRIKICNTKTDSFGVYAETCKLWYSMLLTAQSLGRPVSMSFDTSNPDNSTLTPYVCTEANFIDFATRPSYYLYIEN